MADALKKIYPLPSFCFQVSVEGLSNLAVGFFSKRVGFAQRIRGIGCQGRWRKPHTVAAL